MTARIRRWRRDDPRPPGFLAGKPAPIDLGGPTDAVVEAAVDALAARAVYRRGDRWMALVRDPPRPLRGPRLMPLDAPTLATAVDEACAFTRWGAREPTPQWLLERLSEHPS